MFEATGVYKAYSSERPSKHLQSDLFQQLILLSNTISPWIAIAIIISFFAFDKLSPLTLLLSAVLIVLLPHLGKVQTSNSRNTCSNR